MRGERHVSGWRCLLSPHTPAALHPRRWSLRGNRVLLLHVRRVLLLLLLLLLIVVGNESGRQLPSLRHHRINVVGLGEEGVEAEDQVPMSPKQLHNSHNHSIGIDDVGLELAHHLEELVVDVRLTGKLGLDAVQVGEGIIQGHSVCLLRWLLLLLLLLRLSVVLLLLMLRRSRLMGRLLVHLRLIVSLHGATVHVLVGHEAGGRCA